MNDMPIMAFEYASSSRRYFASAVNECSPSRLLGVEENTLAACTRTTCAVLVHSLLENFEQLQKQSPGEKMAGEKQFSRTTRHRQSCMKMDGVAR